MAIVNYPNLTECLSTDVEGVSPPGFPERPNGWFLKWIDLGDVHHRVGGVWVDWGLGLSFAPPTKSGNIVTDNNGMASITFGTPFYDNAYSVAFTCSDEGGHPPIALLTAQTKTGFSIKTVSSKSGQPMRDVWVSWLCTRNYNE